MKARRDNRGHETAWERPKRGALAHPVGNDALPESARRTIEEVIYATKGHLRAICGDGRNITVYEGLQDVVEGMEISIEKLRLILGGRRGRKGKTATCSICHNPCDARKSHLHQGKLIGDECCWDERLKASE